MKQILTLVLMLTVCSVSYAQHETGHDSLPVLPPPTDTAIEPLPATKSFGGFLIDMTLMNLQAPPRFSEFKLELPEPRPDFSQLFQLNPRITYSQATTSWGISNGIQSWGNSYPGSWGSTPTTLQMESFQLKNGLRIHTYGQYNQEGRKVYNPSALPWERNDFKGAFELKSSNGAFGVRIEVQQHR